MDFILSFFILGRVAVVALTKKQRRELSKMDRRHKANQLRRNKKDSVRN